MTAPKRDESGNAGVRRDSGVVPTSTPSEPQAPASPTRGPGDERTSDVELVNKTARRISIRRSTGEGLILAPFGVLRTREAVARQLELELWLERGYVEQRAPAGDREPAFEASTLAGLFAMLAAFLGLSSWMESSMVAYLGVGVTGATLVPEVRRWLRDRKRALGETADAPSFRDQFWRAMGMLTVFVTGFGLPLCAVYFQTGMTPQEIAMQSGRSLGFLVLFSLFVGSAATLPAMLFFLFAEQRRHVLEEQFHRDILRLDPALRTVDEAERAYSPLLKEALHTRKGPLFFGPILLSTFLLALGWVIAVLPSTGAIQKIFGSPPSELLDLFVPNRNAFTFAFLGTYFFSLNMVFRRYVRADLGPKAYSHVAVRIIIASILAWVASYTLEGATSNGASSSPEGMTPWHLLLFAFFIGIVPETGLAVLHDLLKTRFVSFFIPTLKNRDALTELEGITLYDKTRLLEEGIENIENLAHHNLIELILRTRIPAPRLVDLVDQAILYLHTRDERNPDVSDALGQSRALSRLKAHGIRTATDLEQVASDPAAREPLLALLEGEPHRIRLILNALHDDEWMPQLRSWREFRRTYENVYTLEDLARGSASSRRFSNALSAPGVG